MSVRNFYMVSPIIGLILSGAFCLKSLSDTAAYLLSGEEQYLETAQLRADS